MTIRDAGPRSKRRHRPWLLGTAVTCGAAAAAGVLLLGVTGPVGADIAAVDASAQQEIETHFTTPGSSDIVEETTNLIEATPEGATIHAAQYRLWDEPVTTALEDAVERGVGVQIIVDHGTRNSDSDQHFRSLEATLEEDGDDNTWVKICDDSDDEDADARGCNGSNTMHNKYFAFSQTGGKDDVLAVSSANFSEGTMGGTGGMNGMTVISENAELYDRYLEYTAALSSVADGADPDEDFYSTLPPQNHGNIKSYFYPREEGSGNDTYYNSLSQVDCSAQPTTIRVNMWSITREGIAQKLNDLAEEGCSVDIVANRISSDACELITGGGARPENMEISGFREEKSGTHQKDLMIEGHYVNDDAKVVFTGSPNWNYLSWTDNDESVLRIDDPATHSGFVDHFENEVKERSDVDVSDASECGDIAPPSGAGEQEVA